MPKSSAGQNITKRWDVYPRLPVEVSNRLQDYPPLVRQILFNRGITDIQSAKEYFHALPPDETSPFLLSGMDKAVARISDAIKFRTKIVVYGDYDVDGVTSTVLMVEALNTLGADVSPYIPDRFDEGYGINTDALDKLKSEGCSLVISVDCGVRSILEAEYCKKIGLDLIVTDHHSPEEGIPEAIAVIDPKLPDDRYPGKELAGVGVAYKLAQALFSKANRTIEMGDRWLDLVAIGTVADLAPLTGENRFLVRKGLECIQKEPRPGILQLCRLAGIKHSTITSTNIGFGIGPRLNAAGRMESALAAFDLLFETDIEKAGMNARILDEQNRARQVETRNVVDKAIDLAMEEGPQQDIFIVVDEDFSEGIVGLAASRLVEQFYRPAIVGKKGEYTTRCSCRSIPEFHITEALDECKDLMEHHGGHAAAAGLTIRNEKMSELKIRLREIARKKFSEHELSPVTMADAVLNLSDLGPELHNSLQMFHPIGYSNPEAQFITNGLHIQSIREVGQDGKHLRLTLTDGWLTINAIAFNKGGMKSDLMASKQADFLYIYETNEWNGRVDFQLNIKDIHI
jgi:single-stranded-DNA-specific exonuclease